MIFIDGSVVTVALPTIRDDLGATIAEAQWFANGYVLMLAAFTLLGGSIGDRYGVRRVFVLGVAAFAITSAACAVARTPELLIAARVLQGVAGAVVGPTSLAAIAAAYPAEGRGRAIGIWVGASALAPAVGPVLGGLLVEHAHWSWIFLINLPIAVGAVALALRFLPPSPKAKPDGPLDWPGAALAAVGFGGAAWGLVALGGRDASAASVTAALTVGAAGIAGLIWREHVARAPMLPLVMFRSVAFSGVTTLTALLYAALSATFFLLPFVLIEARGWSVTAVGVAFVPFTVAIALLSGPASRASDRWGPRRSLVLGPALAAAGYLALVLAPEALPMRLGVFVPMTVIGLGFAVAVAPLTTVALASAPAGREGVASGISNAAARAAGLVGGAIAAGLAPELADPRLFEAAFRAVMIGTAASSAAAALLALATIPARIRAQPT
jgi:EmrB/QacA subfamily drug resistance transporter